MLKDILTNSRHNVAIIKKGGKDPKSALIGNLEEKLITIDAELSDLTSRLLQAQVVRIKSGFDSRKGLIGSLQNKFYTAAANESVSWHSKQIKMLINERKKVVDTLDKLKGVYWYKRIRRIFNLCFILLIGVLMAWVAVIGVITAIYALPILLCIFGVYFFMQKKVR